MDLNEYHQGLRARIAAEVSERAASDEFPFPSEELVFAEIVMAHLADAGLTDSPEVCHWSGKLGNSRLRISGYAFSDEAESLDLFVTDYHGSEELRQITDTDALGTAKLGIMFLINAAKGKLGRVVDPSHEVTTLLAAVEARWAEVDQGRVFVITDGQSKSKHLRKQEIEGKPVSVEVIDVERLFRHTVGKPRDEIVVNIEQDMGASLPCVYVPDDAADYDYALAALPGELVRALYDRYGPRLLEANVRSFLGGRGKVNKGIAETLAREPEHFMAYNNGLVVVADEADFTPTPEGGRGLSRLRGLQIVNGGQTTSSIYFAKRRTPDLDISHVRIPAKIIILRKTAEQARDTLISAISRFANSQNAVKVSDLSANRPFHVQLEKLANEIWCPDGVGRWFYERAAGSYETMLIREGTTSAKLRRLKEIVPTSRKLSKNDVAKYHEAWRGMPAQVSHGSEKNFATFMTMLEETPAAVPSPLDASWYKHMIAKAILFRAIERLIKARDRKDRFRQGYANVAAYLVAVLAERIGPRINLDRIWNVQTVSEPMKSNLLSWAEVVNTTFTKKAAGRQFSEVAKRPEIWLAVRDARYPEMAPAPELKSD